jgi:FixJ family two-component response regulator
MGQTPEISRPLVVVVDDNADLLNALSFALQTQGYRSMTFTSADDASAWTGLGDADFLIIDQNLPGDSGLDFLARLREAGCQSPAALITTNPPKAVLELAARANMPIVEKPLLDDGLFALIRAAVAQRRQSAPAAGA